MNDWYKVMEEYCADTMAENVEPETILLTTWEGLWKDFILALDNGYVETDERPDKEEWDWQLGELWEQNVRNKTIEDIADEVVHGRTKEDLEKIVAYVIFRVTAFKYVGERAYEVCEEIQNVLRGHGLGEYRKDKFPEGLDWLALVDPDGISELNEKEG